jgi:hypothetical protein
MHNRKMSEQLGRAARARAWIALMLASVAQPAGATGYYAPRVETPAETCGKSALALHPGKITGTEVLHGGKTVRIELHIKQSDGKAWIVFCDGKSGTLLSTIDVDVPWELVKK